jgi:hypothetical protein
MKLDTTGRSEAYPVRGGPHFLNIDGAAFGGTSVRVDWQEEEGDEWTPLLDESEAALAVTEAYNKIVTLGKGRISFFLTGGTSIDLKATIKRAY